MGRKTLEIALAGLLLGLGGQSNRAEANRPNTLPFPSAYNRYNGYNPDDLLNEYLLQGSMAVGEMLRGGGRDDTKPNSALGQGARKENVGPERDSDIIQFGVKSTEIAEAIGKLLDDGQPGKIITFNRDGSEVVWEMKDNVLLNDNRRLDKSQFANFLATAPVPNTIMLRTGFDPMRAEFNIFALNGQAQKVTKEHLAQLATTPEGNTPPAGLEPSVNIFPLTGYLSTPLTMKLTETVRGQLITGVRQAAAGDNAMQFVTYDKQNRPVVWTGGNNKMQAKTQDEELALTPEDFFNMLSTGQPRPNSPASMKPGFLLFSKSENALKALKDLIGDSFGYIPTTANTALPAAFLARLGAAELPATGLGGNATQPNEKDKIAQTPEKKSDGRGGATGDEPKSQTSNDQKTKLVDALVDSIHLLADQRWTGKSLQANANWDTLKADPKFAPISKVIAKLLGDHVTQYKDKTDEQGHFLLGRYLDANGNATNDETRAVGNNPINPFHNGELRKLLNEYLRADGVDLNGLKTLMDQHPTSKVAVRAGAPTVGVKAEQVRFKNNSTHTPPARSPAGTPGRATQPDTKRGPNSPASLQPDAPDQGASLALAPHTTPYKTLGEQLYSKFHNLIGGVAISNFRKNGKHADVTNDLYDDLSAELKQLNLPDDLKKAIGAYRKQTDNVATQNNANPPSTDKMAAAPNEWVRKARKLMHELNNLVKLNPALAAQLNRTLNQAMPEFKTEDPENPLFKAAKADMPVGAAAGSSPPQKLYHPGDVRFYGNSKPNTPQTNNYTANKSPVQRSRDEVVNYIEKQIFDAVERSFQPGFQGNVFAGSAFSEFCNYIKNVAKHGDVVDHVKHRYEDIYNKSGRWQDYTRVINKSVRDKAREAISKSLNDGDIKELVVTGSPFTHLRENYSELKISALTVKEAAFNPVPI